jgi:hypothetical protein
MSKHWNPEDELVRVREARVKHVWPAGATVGLALVATACAAVVLALYHVAGPRDAFTP